MNKSNVEARDGEAEEDEEADEDVESGKWSQRKTVEPSIDSAVGTAPDSKESEDDESSNHECGDADVSSSVSGDSSEEKRETRVDGKIMRRSAPEYPFARNGDHERSMQKENERRCLEEQIRQKYDDSRDDGGNVVVVQDEGGTAILAAARQSEKETTIVVDAPPSRAVDVVIRGCASGRCVHVTDPVDSEAIDRKLFHQMALRLENIERELRDHAARSDITSIAGSDKEAPDQDEKKEVLASEKGEEAEAESVSSAGSIKRAAESEGALVDDGESREEGEEPGDGGGDSKISLPMITPGFLGNLINLDSVDEDEDEQVTSRFGVLPDIRSSTPQLHMDASMGEATHGLSLIHI